MCTADADFSRAEFQVANLHGARLGSAADALRTASAAMDYLNGAAADLDGAACGEVLIALGDVHAKLTAAHARFLRRFDATGAHDADGYGSSSAWLAARAGMTKKAARTSVRQMRQLGDRPLLGDALAAGGITGSLAFTIADWTRKLPAEMRAETDRILLEAAGSGASLDDLATIAACAIEKWRQQQPDPDNPNDAFEDRFVQVGVTFGGAAVLRGNLTPECASAVRAVLDTLGKQAGPEDDRTEAKRFHDALQLACELLLRARLVPDRAGADTMVIAHVPLSQLRQMPGATNLEDTWIRARVGQDGFMTGKDAQAVACDAPVAPVVTGVMNPDVIDQIISLARTAAETSGPSPEADTPRQARRGGPADTDSAPDPDGANPCRGAMSPEARRTLRHAIARLAVDLVSGPSGVAAVLRRALLNKPYNTPSLPLDVGYSKSIPPAIRRAVQLRDRTCAWPRCDRPAAHCDIHHLRHQSDGGETSVSNCVLLCQFHHDVCIHRRGWQLFLHPDGTTEARSPDGGHVLHSHAPPSERAESAS
jgi:hypothetical protein